MKITILKPLVTAIVVAALVATVDSAAVAEVSARKLDTRSLATAAPSIVTVKAPTSIPKGGRLHFTVKTDPDVGGKGHLQWSTNGTKWNDVGTSIPIADGQGAGALVPTGSYYYRVNVDGTLSDVWRTELVKKSGYAITVGTRTAQFHKNEAAYFVGKAVKGGVPGAFLIKVEYRSSSGSWHRLTTVRASKSGNFAVSARPNANIYFRAKIVSSSGSTLATSPEVFADYTGGSSTLEERRAVMAWRLGAATTSVRPISSTEVAAAKYTGGATSARIQKFKNGFLVEVTSTSGTANTWVIEGRHLAKYLALHAWHGKLGLPERDARCHLLEEGCITLFSGGALYSNYSKTRTGVAVAYGRHEQVEIVAAALHQKNYEEPKWRTNKYNKWISGNHAWCQVFVAWATYASGHKGEAPVESYFPNYVKDLEQSPALIRRPSGSQIVAGDILVFDWGLGTPKHTGIAVKVSGNYVYAIEGNTTDGTGDPQRGVYYRKRQISWIWGMYHPAEYKATASS